MTITARSQQPFFPCLPDLMSWEDWNGNLAIYYGQQNIMFSSEENWKEAATNMMKMESFGAYPLPNPEPYDSWQDWAKEFTLSINGRTY